MSAMAWYVLPWQALQICVWSDYWNEGMVTLNSVYLMTIKVYCWYNVTNSIDNRHVVYIAILGLCKLLPYCTCVHERTEASWWCWW